VLAAWSRHPRTNFCDGTAVHQDALKNGLLRVAGLALEHAQLTIWYQCNIATIHSENAHQPLTGACAASLVHFELAVVACHNGQGSVTRYSGTPRGVCIVQLEEE
jgi:hypothetical protein